MLASARHSPASERTRLQFRHTCRVLALIATALGVFCASPEARARTAAVQSLEAEDATTVQNVGGNAIVTVLCGAARGGLAVDGVDWVGDWIEWNLTLPEEFTFRDSLRSAGAIGLVRKFVVLFLPAAGGPPVAGDTLTTSAGAGFG